MLSIDLLLLVGGTFLLAGTVKGIIGMALPTVSLGILAATLGLTDAIILMLVPSFATNVWQASVGGKTWVLVKRLWGVLAAMAVGIWFASAALALADTSILSVLLGVILAVYAVIGLAVPQLPAPGRSETWLSPLMGGATGILAGLTGSTVMPIVPYLQSLRLPRDEMIQAMGICFCWAALGIGLALGGRNLLPMELGLLSATGVLPAFAGMILGQHLRKRLSEQRFKQLLFMSMAVLGAYITVRAF